MLLEGKRALVTGAASGIGETTAKRLAAEGARVLVVDLNEKDGVRVVEEITAKGGTALFHQADISKPAAANAMVARAVEAWGGLDLAANNAGFSGLSGPLHDTEDSNWHRVIDINLNGTFYCMRAELTQFVKQGGGAIVNTASGAGLKATPTLAAYTAAKHGVVGLTRTGAMDYVKQNIRINAVAPGLTATPAMQRYSAEELKIWAELSPMGRIGSTDEIAAGIAWLLSDQASYITGLVLEIDGGYMQA